MDDGFPTAPRHLLHETVEGPTVEVRELFEILVRQHADMLIAYLRALVRDENLVDDLFQETMLVAWRRIDQFDRHRPFGPWLRGIARRLVLAQYRRGSRLFLWCDEQVVDAIDQMACQAESRAGDTWQDKLAFLAECVDHLPESYRIAVRMRYEKQLGPADIAEELNESLAAIKKRLHRARLRLAACVRRKLDASPAGMALKGEPS